MCNGMHGRLTTDWPNAVCLQSNPFGTSLAILCTSSCLGTDDSSPADRCINGTDIAPADLGRFSANGALSFLNNANGGTAYFCGDGGATAVEDYNNAPHDADYGDWSITCQHVQDAFGCQRHSFDVTNDNGSP